MAVMLVNITKDTKMKSFVKVNHNGSYDITCTPKIAVSFPTSGNIEIIQKLLQMMKSTNLKILM